MGFVLAVSLRHDSATSQAPQTRPKVSPRPRSPLNKCPVRDGNAPWSFRSGSWTWSVGARESAPLSEELNYIFRHESLRDSDSLWARGLIRKWNALFYHWPGFTVTAVYQAGPLDTRSFLGKWDSSCQLVSRTAGVCARNREL